MAARRGYLDYRPNENVDSAFDGWRRRVPERRSLVTSKRAGYHIEAKSFLTREPQIRGSFLGKI